MHVFRAGAGSVSGSLRIPADGHADLRFGDVHVQKSVDAAVRPGLSRGHGGSGVVAQLEAVVRGAVGWQFAAAFGSDVAVGLAAGVRTRVRAGASAQGTAGCNPTRLPCAVN